MLFVQFGPPASHSRGHTCKLRFGYSVRGAFVLIEDRQVLGRNLNNGNRIVCPDRRPMKRGSCYASD